MSGKGISFDEWFKDRHTKTGLYEEVLCGKDDATYIRHEMRKAHKAGAQSRQAEIDELGRKVESNLEINKNLQNMLGELIDERDELQARIDGALKTLDGMRHNGAYRAIDILKGNKDETGLN